MFEKLYFSYEIKQRGGVQRGGHTESRRKPTPGGSDLCAYRRSKERPARHPRYRERDRECVRACVHVHVYVRAILHGEDMRLKSPNECEQENI